MSTALILAPGPGELTLAELRERYMLEKEITVGQAKQLQYTITNFAKFLKHVPTLADFNSQDVNRWILSLVEREFSPATIRGQRINLLCLWRFAYETELMEKGPTRIRPITVPQKPPEAWDPQEMVLLLGTIALMNGRFRLWNIQRKHYWRAFVLVAWDTALRQCDILKIRRDQIPASGEFVMVQSKTLWPVVCKLRPETMAAIDETYGPVRETVFGDVMCNRNVIETFSQILRAAGLKGTFRTIRKSAATALELQKPGWAKVLLGHKTPGLAERHYIDPVKVQAVKPLTPQIVEFRPIVPAVGQEDVA